MALSISVRNKFFSTVAILLMLSFVLPMAGTTFAQTTPTTPTYAFIAATPNPAQVGKSVLLIFWLSDPLPSAANVFGDRYNNFNITITSPDGTTQTKGPFTGNDLSSAYTTFTPTQTGTYNITFNFPGEYFHDINIQYLPSSRSISLTVQNEPVPTSQNVPLPTTYWSRPVSADHYGWQSITGNWLMPAWNSTVRFFDDGSAFDPEGAAPTSSHVLWTSPITFGGLAGGIYGTEPYYSGQSYEEYLKPPVIIDGRLYYNTLAGSEPNTNGNLGNLGITCVNLTNGVTLFTIPNASLSFGQILNTQLPNQAGTFAYLWSTGFGPTPWKMYDAWTGNYILSISDVPGGVTTYGPNGEIITYSISYSNTLHSYALTKWNSTQVFQTLMEQANSTNAVNNVWTWRPYDWAGQTLNGSLGIMWTVAIANKTGQSLTQIFNQGGMFDGNTIIADIAAGSNQAFTNTTSTQGIELIGYSMTDGSQQFDTTILPPPNMPNDLNGIDSFEYQWEYNGYFFQYIKQTEQWTAYDVTTGKLLWISPADTNPWGMYNEGAGSLQAFGNFYVASFDGTLFAYNMTTGKIDWQWSTPNAGSIENEGVFTLYDGITIVGNTLIVQTGEHGNGVEPMYQGQAVYAFNAVTGQPLWNMSGWFEQPDLADGIMISHNYYDNLIFAFGKGPSATTVTAPATAVSPGSGIVIQGTVTDQSPGAKGTPAISDAYMSDWMAYLYEQTPLPASFPCSTAGVQVTLTAVGPNGNTINIGTTTSDYFGHYSFLWNAPSDAGLYRITAAFAGSNSYYSSAGETSVAVGSASSTASPAPTSTSTPSAAPMPAQSPSTAIYVVIAAIIIIIIAVAAALVLRRRR